MTGRYDPADRPESYALGGAVTTTQERARASHDNADRTLLLQMLGLLDRNEIRTQLAHTDRTLA